ncbi:hypothetical protein EV126DRAFT_214012 [Verticillium dahliae]|nr:hypothetical protein EV126DRAFT_214012 [Verticillium dahliae]
MMSLALGFGGLVVCQSVTHPPQQFSPPNAAWTEARPGRQVLLGRSARNADEGGCQPLKGLPPQVHLQPICYRCHQQVPTEDALGTSVLSSCLEQERHIVLRPDVHRFHQTQPQGPRRLPNLPFPLFQTVTGTRRDDLGPFHRTSCSSRWPSPFTLPLGLPFHCILANPKVEAYDSTDQYASRVFSARARMFNLKQPAKLHSLVPGDSERDRPRLRTAHMLTAIC